MQLGGFDQVIHIDVEIVIELNEIDGWLCLHLVNDQPRSLSAVLGHVLHLLPHQALDHLSGLRGQHLLVLCHRRAHN